MKLGCNLSEVSTIGRIGRIRDKAFGSNCTMKNPNKMKRILSNTAISCAVLAPGLTWGNTIIPVPEHSFETPVLTPGFVHSSFIATVWERFSQSGVAPAGTINHLDPSLLGTDGNNVLEVAEGQLVLLALDEVFEANTEYFLRVSVGNRPSFTRSNNESLFALVDGISNGEFLIVNAGDLEEGEFFDFVLSFSTVEHPSAVGRPITINFDSRFETEGSGSDYFDNVRLMKRPTSLDWTVTSLSDSGVGSLREAIDCAATGSTIRFAPEVFNQGEGNQILLETPLVIEGKNLEISASNIPGGVILSGASVTDRESTMILMNQASATIGDLEFRDGLSRNGGAVSVERSSDLTLEFCLFQNNSAFLNGSGGAILASGDVTMTNCTFFDNSSDASGSAVFVGQDGSLFASHCTVTGNSAFIPAGGGLSSVNGAIQTFAAVTSPATLHNCIVSGNMGSDAAGAGLVSRGGNVIGTLPMGFNPSDVFLGSDQIGVVEPKLGDLAANGGTVKTIYPLPDSPAIDNGRFIPELDPGVDARRVPTNFGGLPDAGAVQGGRLGTQSTIPTGATGFADISLPMDAVRAVPVTGSPSGEGVRFAIDNDPATKYLNFTNNSTGFKFTPTIGDAQAVGVTLTSANDAPRRDPAIVSLIGHRLGSRDVVLGTGTVDFTARGQERTFYIREISEVYESFSVLFLAIDNDRDDPNGNPSGDLAQDAFPQIAEVEFLGIPAESESARILDITLAPDDMIELTYIAGREGVFVIEQSFDLDFSVGNDATSFFMGSGFMETVLVDRFSSKSFYRIRNVNE